jgi:hypothetical protein
VASLTTYLPGRRRRHEKAIVKRIDELTASNRRSPDPAVERELLRLRHRAFAQLKTGGSAGTASPNGRAELEIVDGIPVIDGNHAGAGMVRAAIERHGSVRIRGLLPAEEVERLKRGIDATFDASGAYGEAKERGDLDGFERSGAAAYFHPFKPLPGYTLGGGRNWNRNDTSIWAADSPRVMFELVEAFDRHGISRLTEDYLGERPAISMNKTMLRRVPPSGGGADWHQDGAFLGDDIRSLNVWLALTPCGRDAPGMDVVGRRLEEIVPTGGEGANFNWSVAPEEAERAAGEAGVVRPEFEAGDALLFDHLMLHRTASEPTMTKPRYAIETWFFAPSAYPAKQVPLVL